MLHTKRRMKRPETNINTILGCPGMPGLKWASSNSQKEIRGAGN